MFDTIPLKLALLSLLQLLPLWCFVRKQRFVFLSVHLAGLFAFTTWKKYFWLGNPNLSHFFPHEVLDYLLVATCSVHIGFFATKKILQNIGITLKENTFFFELSLRPLTFISTFLLFSFVFLLVPHAKVPVLSLQALACITLIVNRGPQFIWGQLAVLFYLFFYFLIQKGTLLGLELVVISLLAFILFKKPKSLFSAALILLVISLEMFKPSYRGVLAKFELTFFDRLKTLSQVIKTSPNQDGPIRAAKFDVPLAYNIEEPLIKTKPKLTELRIRRTLFPKQLGWKALRDLNLEDAYHEFILSNIKLLALPRGILNPNLILQFPKENHKKRWQEELRRSLMRVGDESLEAVLTFTPHFIPYGIFDTYKATLRMFIPSFLWPSKPKNEIWNQFGRTYRVIDSQDDATSVSFTYLTEGFMTFGMLGLLGAALCMGMALSLLELTTSYIKNENLRTLTLVTLSACFFLPYDSFTIGSKVLHFGEILLVLGVFLKRWEIVSERTKVKSPKVPEWKSCHLQEQETTPLTY